MKLEQLTIVDFQPLVHQSFELRRDNGDIVLLRLIKVKQIELPPFRSPWAEEDEPEGRQPFLIWFRGPVESPLPQQMYNLWHDQLGEIRALFLAPLGMDHKGRYYEAVFN